MTSRSHPLTNCAVLLVSVSGLLLLHSLAQAQPAVAAKFVRRIHVYKGVLLPYRLYTPEGTIAGRKYPIVLALHDGAARGSDNEAQLTIYNVATAWADSTNQAHHPCYVAAPQCPDGHGWSTESNTPTVYLAAANDLLDSLAREFPVDTNRRYVTGMGIGGFGTWAIAVTSPDRFAAIVPVSAGEKASAAPYVQTLPIWTFHGSADPWVPLSEPRQIIDSLRHLGRPVVYTHCWNRDCSGLPDSTVEMYVRSHRDLFYSEVPDRGHDAAFWNEVYASPHLVSWMFDKHKERSGAISIKSPHAYESHAGSLEITWSTSIAGDSVEIWFSPDVGATWKPVGLSLPNNGSYLWNTNFVGDCSFGQIQIFLKDGTGNIIGRDRSSFFALDNTGHGAPFIRIVNDEFTTGDLFDSDTLNLRMLIGNPSPAMLRETRFYSQDGGITFQAVDSLDVTTDSLMQTQAMYVKTLPNSDQAVLRVDVSNAATVATAQTYPFPKRSSRQQGREVVHPAGPGTATVSVNIVFPEMLTGDQYRVMFDDTSATRKTYSVHDVTRGAELVRGATELDGVTEGPLFDGIRLVIADLPAVRVDTDSTGWKIGQASINVQVMSQKRVWNTVEITPYLAPYDYRLTISDRVMDTSKAAYVFAATPMKFLVWNTTKDRKADVLFYDSDGDSSFSSLDEVDILERDSLGQLVLSWGLLPILRPGETSPSPGDEFHLKILKPLSSADVYEFIGSPLSSVSTAIVPARYMLAQNYPNPFNPTTTIGYGVPSRSHVRLTIFNTLGQKVVELVHGEVEAGYHEVVFNAANLATGIYFYRLESGSFLQSKKLLFIK